MFLHTVRIHYMPCHTPCRTYALLKKKKKKKKKKKTPLLHICHASFFVLPHGRSPSRSAARLLAENEFARQSSETE